MMKDSTDGHVLRVSGYKAREFGVSKMADKVDEFRALYRMVYHEHRHDMITDLYRLEAELVIAGYRIVNAWGHYLHTPDGEVITLDDWNDKLDK